MHSSEASLLEDYEFFEHLPVCWVYNEAQMKFIAMITTEK